MKFTILGCGSSMGVPRSDGFFGNCDPKNKKNYRTRCSALIQTQSENVLIDTSPDLRVFYIQNKKTIPVYADNPTKKYLFNTFKYCFINNNKEYPATLKLNSINDNLTILDGSKILKVKTIKVKHGNVNSICYVIDKKIAYISDISDISKKDYKFFRNFKFLIIDCLWLH